MGEVGKYHWRSCGPTSLLGQGAVEHISQDCVWLAFEYLQGRRVHKISGQPAKVILKIS